MVWLRAWRTAWIRAIWRLREKRGLSLHSGKGWSSSQRQRTLDRTRTGWGNNHEFGVGYAEVGEPWRQPRRDVISATQERSALGLDLWAS